MTPRHLAAAVAACFALACASLAIPHEPVYDPWAWLVWGRELASLDLDTSSGPSWKPLPVALTAVLSLAGDAAPALWLVLVRTAWLLAPVLAAALAYRLAAGLHPGLRGLAAGFAALSLLLLADSFTMWTRQGAVGLSEPLLVALVLGAICAALGDRPRPALGLGVLAALLRPEVWPLLGAYGLWTWRTVPALRGLLAGLAVAVPALWVVPDMLGSGGATNAGGRALHADGAPLHELFEVFARAAVMPLAVVWPLALLGFVAPRLRRAASSAPAASAGSSESRALTVLAAGAFAWIAIVAVMAAAGFPGLPRFMAGAIAIVGVLAGVGLAHLLALGRRPLVVVAAALAVLALAGPQIPGRAEQLPNALATTARLARSHDRVRTLVRAVGRERMLRCGSVATSDLLVRNALAWELRVPLSKIVSFGALPGRSGAFVAGPRADRRLIGRLPARAELLGARGEWRVYSVRCSPTAAASSSRSAGVSGAQR